MDLVASCKEKLQYFRIKELKDVLTHLGLSKQGKKQDLVDRILAILSEDQGLMKRGTAKLNSEADSPLSQPASGYLASERGYLGRVYIG